MENLALELGEKVDLYLGRGPYYRTAINDISDDGTVLVSIPTFKGVPIILRQDQDLKLFFYRDNGRYAVGVRVRAFEMDDPVRLARLEVTTQPVRQQRRTSFRVASMLQVILRPYALGPFPRVPNPGEADQMEQAPTINISSTGVAVRASGDYSVGERVYLRILLAWPQPDYPPLDIFGEIRQVVRLEPDADIFHVGIMYLNVSDEISAHLSKFVMFEEKRIIKKKRLIEGE